MTPYKALKARMVECANAHTEAMQGMNTTEALDYVRAVIDSNEVVFGVYPNASEPDGVGMRPIKGIADIWDVADSHSPERFLMNAVPCIEEAQAIAAARVLGDDKGKTSGAIH
jgi:hypothetical protein